MAKIDETDRFTPRFGADGLMPCVAVDFDTGAVLMLAWVNSAAIDKTLETGFAHYWSRSRQALWKKGETSGAFQAVREVRTDCDQDALVYRVVPRRRADTCHTGRTTCFYRTLLPAVEPGEARFRLRIDDD